MLLWKRWCVLVGLCSPTKYATAAIRSLSLMALVPAGPRKRPRPPSSDVDARPAKRLRGVTATEIVDGLKFGQLGDAKLFLALQGHAWRYGWSLRTGDNLSWQHGAQRALPKTVRAAISATLAVAYNGVLTRKDDVAIKPHVQEVKRRLKSVTSWGYTAGVLMFAQQIALLPPAKATPVDSTKETPSDPIPPTS